jgi:hypothetical protein
VYSKRAGNQLGLPQVRSPALHLLDYVVHHIVEARGEKPGPAVRDDALVKLQHHGLVDFRGLADDLFAMAALICSSTLLAIIPIQSHRITSGSLEQAEYAECFQLLDVLCRSV